MAKITKKEFAVLCEVGTNDLSNYIKRGKVNVVDGFIDTDDKTNVYFYEKRVKLNLAKKAANRPTMEVDISNPKDSEPSDIQTSTTETPVPESLNERVAKKKEKEIQPAFKFPAEAPLTRNTQIDNELKEEALKREKLNSQILQSKLNKTLGESVPTDLIRNIIANHTKSIATAFKNGGENLILLFSAAHELTSVQISELRKSLTEITNKAINEAVDESQATLRAITDEFSQKKEVGEREL